MSIDKLEAAYYIRVTSWEGGAETKYYRKTPHEPAELTPILLNAILESQNKTEKHTKIISIIITILFVLDIISALVLFFIFAV